MHDEDKTAGSLARARPRRRRLAGERATAQQAGPGDLLAGAAGHLWYTALGSCPGG